MTLHTKLPKSDFSVQDTREKTKNKRPKPYIASNGDLVIPFDCDPKYKWWNGGQSVTETLKELQESQNAKHNP